MKLPTLNALSIESLAIQTQLQETGELSPELEIRHDENKQQLAVKLDHYCYAYLAIEAKEEYLANLKKQVDAAQKSLAKQKDYLLNKVELTKEIHNFEANNFKFAYRKSSSVVIEDVNKLPMDCVRVKVEPDKAKIKELLANGPVEGAKIEVKMNLGFKGKL